MSQEYSNPKRASEPHALPDIEVFELTAAEVVVMDEDLMHEASKHFPLMHMNGREQEKAIDWAIEESGTTGGWFWHTCLPGCLPDSDPMGPFATRAEALADAHEGVEDEDELLWFTSSSGRIELQMTLDQARSASHQGQCDDDVRELSKVPEIAAQLAAIKPEDLRAELREYGAWDTDELADHEQNLQRILWLAASDIREENV